MQIGDLVDDGFDNIGIIVELGWLMPESMNRLPAVLVHFPDPKLNGWYEAKDLEKI